MEGKEALGNDEERFSRRNVVKMMGVLSMGAFSTTALAADQKKGSGELKVLTFLTLKEAKASGLVQEDTVVQTLGYHALHDGGGATYHISKQYGVLQPNEGDVVLFDKGRIGVLVDCRQVNYRMFGVVGDGKNDDGVQIKMAHEYANKHKLPIVNHSGEYWIEATRNIPVQSSVYWGETIFHINESLNTKAAVFRVSSRYKPADIKVDTETKRKILAAIKPGLQVLPELKQYKNHLIFIIDNNDRIGFRAGDRFEGQSWAREEFFYMEEDGRVIGDIAWSFKDYTSLRAYPAEQSYLIVDGGTFYLSGDSHPEREKKGYFQNGISVTRSRTIIRNQWIGLEKGKTDIAFNPRSGFYSIGRVYEITLENIRLIPWEQDREGKENDLYAGTYGIGMARVMNSTFRNITAEGSLLHWGVFGTNLNKNFRIEKCQFNRVDVHFHCWNLTIQDSQIGHRGIMITGGGELIIENTTCSNQQFVGFRYDYGAKWEGSVYINNCCLKPSGRGEASLLRFVAGNFDYRYPIGMAEKIHIQNFTFDFSNVPDNNAACLLFQTSAFSKTKFGERLFFPKSLVCNHVTVRGRKKGIRLFNLVSPDSYGLYEEGGYNGSFVQCNSRIAFENIQLEKMEAKSASAYHLQFSKVTEDGYDSFSLYPHIHFNKCDNLALDLDNGMAHLLVENCTVSRVVMKNKHAEASWINSRFLPELPDESAKPYQLSAGLGMNFVNCVFHLPRLRGEGKPELLNQIELIQLNKTVQFSHVNSRLGSDVLDYCRQNGIVLIPAFINKLKNHHELEQ